MVLRCIECTRREGYNRGMNEPVQYKALDFTRLDDICSASSQPVDKVRQFLLNTSFEALGPSLAFCHLYYVSNELVDLCELDHWPIIAEYLRLRQSESLQRTPVNLSWDPLRVELTWTPLCPEHFRTTQWSMFKHRFERAARTSGIAPLNAAALVAACEEMVDNVIEHSERPESAIAGYAHTNGNFEYAIVDHGIGVLASLRKCSDYDAIRGHDNGLRIAVQPGESRYGRSAGHGFGFKEVVRSLQRLYGCMRFQSGDHCIDIEGNTPALDSMTIRQTFIWEGFLISITCSP